MRSEDVAGLFIAEKLTLFVKNRNSGRNINLYYRMLSKLTLEKLRQINSINMQKRIINCCCLFCKVLHLTSFVNRFVDFCNEKAGG